MVSNCTEDPTLDLVGAHVFLPLLDTSAQCKKPPELCQCSIVCMLCISFCAAVYQQVTFCICFTPAQRLIPEQMLFVVCIREDFISLIKLAQNSSDCAPVTNQCEISSFYKTASHLDFKLVLVQLRNEQTCQCTAIECHHLLSSPLMSW